MAARMHEMLGTKNKAEQERIVENLLTNPPVAVTVYFDLLSKTVDIRAQPGSQIPIGLIKIALQAALEKLTKQEGIAEAQEAAKQQAQAEGSDGEGMPPGAVLVSEQEEVQE